MGDRQISQENKDEAALGLSQQKESGGDGIVRLGDFIEIYTDKPCLEIASDGRKAFEAKDTREEKSQFAILAGRADVPRFTAVASYKNLKSQNILKLTGAGIVDWVPEGRQRFALIYERPPAKRLMETFDGDVYSLSEDKIMSVLVQPILSVLSDFRNIDLIHGFINAQNIFFSGVEGAETAILGECLSGAPSSRQSVLFEPLDRAMAHNMGRGRGTAKDDLYAFGVCVGLAVRGRNLLADKTPEEIIQKKISDGTYSILMGRDRVPPSISEFLRGVLHDDPALRWNIDEAMRWLDGRRLSPKQPPSLVRAARPFIFQDKKYWDLRSLAWAFSQNVAAAAVVIEGDEFSLWMKRNFENKDLEERLEEARSDDSGAGRDYKVCGVCMALDPSAPVHYKGLSMFPTGFGHSLINAISKESDLQLYGEIILHQLFSKWVHYRFDEIPDAAGILTSFDKARSSLSQKISGYGLERVLYMLNKECACMSPLLKNYFIINPGGLLQALDHIAKKENRPGMILDRHMIAFISVREAKMIDPYLGYITSPMEENRVVGITRCLAAIQRRFQTGPLPHLTNWLADLMLPAVNRFNSLDLRERVKKQMGIEKSKGNLFLLLDLIDDAQIVQEDNRRYLIAKDEYKSLVQEHRRINSYIQKRRNFGHATGRQVAMLISAILASISIILYLIYYFSVVGI